MKYILHVGIDDTDSNELGMCTTYVGALADELLSREGFERAGDPRLVRLNPAYPYKTRGNGAIHLRFYADGREDALRTLELLEGLVASQAALADPKAEPGIAVLLASDASEPLLEPLYRAALTGIARREDALMLLTKAGGLASWFKGGRGIVGAAAALGAPESDMKTYELLAYRVPSMRGKDKPRMLDEESVKLADLASWPLVYDTYDWYSMEPLLAPHTPCPVLLGLRGFDRDALLRAFGIIRPLEPVERVMIYRANHGSGVHVVDVGSVGEIQPYTTPRIMGTVASRPEMTKGGHVFFTLSAGGEIRVGVYRPTGHLRYIAMELLPGDRVRVAGSYKPRPGEPPTINAEVLEVLELVEVRRRVAPRCPRCGAAMESAGKGKGYRCVRCGYNDPSATPLEVRTPRGLVRGIYLPPPRAHRHLTKPYEAMGCRPSEGG